MAPDFIETSLPGVILVEPDLFTDPRGFFMETYHSGKYAEGGIDRTFVQDNYSHSTRGTLRGLHYQLNHPQGKLVYVINGEVFDVAVDIRKGSPTFGQWTGTVLSSENRRQLFVSEGFAHGFIVLSDSVDLLYKCTDLYHPEDDHGILWSDPLIGIDWPLKDPLLSDKDSINPKLSDLPDSTLPRYIPSPTSY